MFVVSALIHIRHLRARLSCKLGCVFATRRQLSVLTIGSPLLQFVYIYHCKHICNQQFNIQHFQCIHSLDKESILPCSHLKNNKCTTPTTKQTQTKSMSMILFDELTNLPYSLVCLCVNNTREFSYDSIC